MTTTETTTPVVDRLFGFVAFLAKANRSDLAEYDHVARFMPTYNGGMDLQLDSNERSTLLAYASIITDPTLSGMFFTDTERRGRATSAAVHLSLNGRIGDVPWRIWTALDVPEGVTAELVVGAAERDLAALTDSRGSDLSSLQTRVPQDPASWSGHASDSREG